MSAADPTATFYQHLQSSRLLTDAQMRELWGWVTYKKPDLKALAGELHRRGWLSTFQIKEIARGRASGLRIADRYALIDIVGEGGMGRVYKAHDTRMGRDVALKVIRKEKLSNALAASRFQQEMLALGALARHANVVATFDAAQVGDHHFCVMEFIDGSDLTKLVREKGPMSVLAACDAIRQAALGLQHAYETGIIHRDIKPSNIIVPRNGGPVKLVDLGLARVLDAPGGEEANRITQQGFVIGTPDFLAPEQARNPMAVDIRADIYALGGTLFYILTGRVPYENGSPTEKLLRHCTEPPPNLLQFRPDAPPALEQLIHWCMAKSADDRPQTPQQLANALVPFCPPPQAGTGTFVVAPSGHYPVPGAPLLSGAHRVPAAPAPGYGAPPPGYPYPAYPQPPVYAPPGMPLPQPDPDPSNRAFQLPPQTTDEDPIRRRSSGGFPIGMVLIGLGALFLVGVLGFATWRVFLYQPPATPEPFTNTQGMKMVRLEGGTFKMGSPDNEPGRKPDEGPVREVTIRGPFFMSATEVTNGQFLKVMGTNKSQAATIAARAEFMPVDYAMWEDAVEFCKKLTEKEKGQPWSRKNWEYRLPTEAEWEYAARAGTETPFAHGMTVKFGDQSVFRPLDDEGMGIGGDPIKPPRFAHDAGKSEPNKFGLYDMHGNVGEWCSDWYKSEAYKDGARDNPTGPSDGDKKVVRGGSFRDPASATRSAARGFERPAQPRDYIGFRVIYAPIIQK